MKKSKRNKREKMKRMKAYEDGDGVTPLGGWKTLR